LVLREQAVADADVALGRSADHDRLSFVFVVVDLASRGTAEDFELQFAATVIFIDVESLRDVDLLLLLLLLMTLIGPLGLDVLLDVCVHVE
jgi:hypothetical protein